MAWLLVAREAWRRHRRGAAGVRAGGPLAKWADTWLWARVVEFVEWFHEWFRVVVSSTWLIEIITYVAAAWKSKLALGL